MPLTPCTLLVGFPDAGDWRCGVSRSLRARALRARSHETDNC
ncbi:hypothetical protein [Scytonema sp. HK-05]|nr:hypothetical protein [Scytonema sp. HK-05]